MFVLGTFQLSAWAKTSQKLWVEKVEQRLGVTNSSLVAMRVVKMLGLSNKIYDIITEFRRVEIICSSRFRQLLIGKIFFCELPSYINTIILILLNNDPLTLIQLIHLGFLRRW